jgi:pimeloyl-ACP methyl ester carboxylesterase
MPSPRPKNSTTVRLLPIALRLGIRALGALLPALAARIVLRLWLTPVRAPPRADAVPLPAPGTVRHGELDLPVWTFGEGPPVYLVHGWGGRAEQLLPLVEPLVEAGHAVVLFDGPAHGRAPGRQTSGPELAAALQAIAAHHGPPFAIVAHSFGAVPTALALQAGLPARRVVLLAPPAHLGRYVDRFATMVGASPAVRERMRALVPDRLRLPWSAMTLEALAGRQTAPLLVLHDRQDREVAVDEGEAVARTWPGAELHVTRGLGHWRILRDPGVILRTVSFVTGAAAPDRARAADPEQGATATLADGGTAPQRARTHPPEVRDDGRSTRSREEAALSGADAVRARQGIPHAAGAGRRG